jgi:uncharacterized protein YeaO (DUF488 family)
MVTAAQSVTAPVKYQTFIGGRWRRQWRNARERGSGGKYRQELKEAGTIDKRNRVIKNHGQKFTLRLLQKLGQSQNVTLMCHCDEDQKQCHRHLLKKVLTTKI